MDALGLGRDNPASPLWICLASPSSKPIFGASGRWRESSQQKGVGFTRVGAQSVDVTETRRLASKEGLLLAAIARKREIALSSLYRLASEMRRTSADEPKGMNLTAEPSLYLARRLLQVLMSYSIFC